MTHFLAEVYVPRLRAGEAGRAGERARAAADNLSSQGVSIRYVRTTYLPDDEMCFHLFEAASAEVVEEAVARASLGRARVVPAIETSRRTRRP